MGLGECAEGWQAERGTYAWVQTYLRKAGTYSVGDTGNQPQPIVGVSQNKCMPENTRCQLQPPEQLAPPQCAQQVVYIPATKMLTSGHAYATLNSDPDWSRMPLAFMQGVQHGQRCHLGCMYMRKARCKHQEHAKDHLLVN